MVTPSEVVGRGLRRLLEREGDIEVIATLPSLEDLDRTLGAHGEAAVVIGPGTHPSPADWRRIVRINGRPRAVLLAAVPGRHRHPRGVVEVPMELSGAGLRRAVRACVPV